MTVQDLIDSLSKMDRSLEVGTNKEDCFYESMYIEKRKIYDDASFVSSDENHEVREVVVLVCD